MRLIQITTRLRGVAAVGLQPFIICSSTRCVCAQTCSCIMPVFFLSHYAMPLCDEAGWLQTPCLRCLAGMSWSLWGALLGNQSAFEASMQFTFVMAPLVVTSVGARSSERQA